MFRKMFTGLAIFFIFFGVVSSLILDVGALALNPNRENAVKIAEDIGKSVFNSQEVVQESYLKLNQTMNADDNLKSSMSAWLFVRVIAGSMVTLAIFWLLWKGLTFLAPAAEGDMGTRLIIVLLIVGIIWGSTLVYSYSFTDEGFLPPFHGWITIVDKPHILADFLGGTQYTSPIERIGLNQTNATNQTTSANQTNSTGG